MPTLEILKIYVALALAITAAAVLRLPWRLAWLHFLLKFILRYLSYPLVSSKWTFLSFSWLKLLVYLSYWALGACCTFIGVNDTSSAGDRSALIAVTNILPGLLASSSKFATKLLSLSTGTAQIVHVLCGSGTVVFAILHAVLALIKNSSDPFSSHLFATLSGIILVSLAVVVLPPCRRRLPCLSSYSHQVFGISFVLCLYFHIGDVAKPSAILLVVSAAAFGAALAFNLASSLTQLLRRIPSAISFDENSREKNFLNVEVKMRGAPIFKAGDIVWIYTRSSWYLKGFPMPIAWSSVSSEHGIITTLLSFIDRKTPLGRSLDSSQYKNLEVGVLGPYGKRTQLDRYGTAMLLATDLGIVPQLFHFKQILNERNDGYTCTVAVVVIWQVTDVNDFVYEVADNIQEMMRQTQTSIHVRIYSSDIERIKTEVEYRRDNKKLQEEPKLGDGHDIYKAGGAPWPELIAKTAQDKAGSMLVLGCTDDESRTDIRSTMSRIGQSDIRYQEIDVQAF